MRTNLILTTWVKYSSELPVAISRGDALSISGVRLPRQSAVASFRSPLTVPKRVRV